jgi:hypothetical protein
LPLQLWFWVAYLTTTATLGIGRYQTEWVVLRKLRRVMVNLEAFPADRGGVPLAKLAEDNTRNYSTGHRFPITTQLGNAG